MNLDSLNKWLTLITNVGVLAGIVFLAVEIQQNTRTIEREASVVRADVLNGQFVSSDHLPLILDKMNEVKGHPTHVLNLAETFNLTNEEANRWGRYLGQIWQVNEANWETLGRSDRVCDENAFLLRAEDNEIYWSYARSRLNPEFVECVENALERIL